MKLSHLSASTLKGLISAVAPYVKNAEGSDYSALIFTVARTEGAPDAYTLQGCTTQPDHEANFSYPLDEGSVTIDRDDEVGQLYSLDFGRMKKALASIGAHNIDIEISPIADVTPDDVHMRITVAAEKADEVTPTTADQSPQKAQRQTVVANYDLPITPLTGSLCIPKVEGFTVAPMVLGHSLQATYKAVSMAGRGYRSSTAAHLRISSGGIAAEALTSNLFVASDWGTEAIQQLPPAITSSLHVELSVNTTRRLYEVSLREGTPVTLAYDPAAKRLYAAIGLYTFSVRAEAAANHPAYGFADTAFAEGDEWSQFFVDRRQLTSAFQRARTLGLQTVGIEFSPGGSIEVLDIEGEYTTRISAAQHLFCEPRVSRTFEVSVPAMLAFLPLLTSDDVAIDFAREDAPIRITGVTPADSITAVVRTL